MAASETAAQTTIAMSSAFLSTRLRRIKSADLSGLSSSEEAAAKPAPSRSPIGVAITKPLFGDSRRTPGVASACRPRKPALARKVSETRKSRASARRRAASLVTTARTTLVSAAVSTSQKWAG